MIRRGSPPEVGTVQMSRWPPRSLWKAIARPSGDHAGYAPCSTSRTGVPPAAGTSTMSPASPCTNADSALRPPVAFRRPSASRATVKATCVPSGDHAGWASSLSVAARTRTAPPATGATRMSSEPRASVV